jgi:protein involved in polysaccharide export with SLBB domain
MRSPSTTPRKTRTLTVVLLLCAGRATACKTPNPTTGGGNISREEVERAAADAGTHSASTLGAGDMVEVRVYQEPELSGIYRLSAEGTIDYPLCGKVTLVEMTSSQATDAVTRCLADGYIKKPQVSLLIREYSSKKIFVFGEVQKPGTFPYEESMSIIQAVTLAGGFTKLSAKNSTHVTRIIEGSERKIRVPVEDIGVGREKNFVLQPGDIVFVPESFF